MIRSNEPYLTKLTEVVIRSTDTLEDLKERVRIATILGTLQSTLTDFKYLRKVWQKNAEEERLLGVSLTGIMDHPIMSGQGYEEEDMVSGGISERYKTLRRWLRELKQVAVDTNKEWAAKLGISESKQITLIKPSGTVSSLFGTSSGIHPRFAPYYIRRATQDLKDPLTQLMIDQGVPHVITKDKAIFEFVIKSPSTSVMKRAIGPIEQLEVWKVYAEEWCDGNPSQTIYYDDTNFLEVSSWVYRNWDHVVGLSFFPADDHVYENAPFEEITKEEYERRVAEFPDLDFSLLSDYEKDSDAITTQAAIACGGGSCEL